MPTITVAVKKPDIASFMDWIQKKNAQDISTTEHGEAYVWVTFSTEPGHRGRRGRLDPADLLRQRREGASFRELAEKTNATKSSVFAAVKKAEANEKANKRKERAKQKELLKAYFEMNYATDLRNAQYNIRDGQTVLTVLSPFGPEGEFTVKDGEVISYDH